MYSGQTIPALKGMQRVVLVLDFYWAARSPLYPWFILVTWFILIAFVSIVADTVQNVQRELAGEPEWLASLMQED